ncbi:MAG TPA: FAD-dependent oxidoreductase [Pseudonocardiaceae bacterium]|jgi:NADPH-dependent 2,4-dienoyl-CoA reductase/sulfur reductase-like enzyme
MRTVVIVGAGPAGLAAADSALRAGAEVSLLDASPQPGGQFHRMLPTAYAATHPERVQHGWRAFAALRQRVLDHPGCTWWSETTVWAIEPGPRVHVVRGLVDGVGRARYVLAPDALVLATGAHDRVLPFPGWQLPGVFTAGAAQAFAKGERVAIGERVVVAGSGPFLLPVTAALLEAGSRVLGVFEANPASTVLRGWASRPWEVAGKAGELLGYAAGLARNRVPYRMGCAVIAARGTERVDEVVIARLRTDWSVVPGTERTLAVDAVCVGHGFSPQTELAVAAGCELTAAGFVVVGEGQRTSVPGVYAAGEITGIAGAPAAAAEGTVAGWYAAKGEPRIATVNSYATPGEAARSGAPLGGAARGSAAPGGIALGNAVAGEVLPGEVAPGKDVPGEAGRGGVRRGEAGRGGAGRGEATPGRAASWRGATQGESMPGRAAPGDAAPSGEGMCGATPGSTASGDGAPGGAVPGEVALGGGVPGGAVPSGSPSRAAPSSDASGGAPSSAAFGGAVPSRVVRGEVVRRGVAVGGGESAGTAPNGAGPSGAASSEAASGEAALGGAVSGEAAAGGVGLGRGALRRAAWAKAFAARLARAHPIGAGWVGWLQPDTIVCRCEETTFAALCEAATNPSMMDDRALRLATRAGLGPCQGRMCGPTVAELTASPTNHRRPIAQPVRLGELAEPPVSKED